MRETSCLPAAPRGDAFLDVGWQLPEVMPKLYDRSGDGMQIPNVDVILPRPGLDQISNKFRALSMVLATVIFIHCHF